MKKLLSLLFLLSLPSSAQQVLKGWPCGWENGYEKGVSACYGGVVGNCLIMAGGANFAEKPAAEGGRKCFYKGIYATTLWRQGEKESKTLDSLEWRKIGELPEPMAYGVSVVCRDRLIIIGGSNDDGSLQKVYSINATGEVEQLPCLPMALDNSAGCIYNNKVYVGGGMSNGKENLKVFCLDLSKQNPQWEETTDFLGTPSVQPVVCIKEGKPLFFGGYSPKTADHYANVYDGPSGGALVQLPDGEVYTSGGVNHEIFLDAISGTYSLISKKDYLLQPVSWYQFENKLQKYNVENNTYKFVYESEDIARAGALMVTDGKNLYVIGGEIKPGIRTNSVFKLNIKN